MMSVQRIASQVIATAMVAMSAMVAPSALAHAHLKSQYPAASAQMTAAPQALTLTFSEKIETEFSGLTLTGPDNTAVATGPIKRDPANGLQIIVPLEKPLTSGSYQVKWHVLSVDGHKTQGDYSFSVK
ncbi:hypothetical protein EDC52_101355 [Biostraticola tofi]|uniref:Copper resistance protein C n=2 Tax=Biostraticola tofi TaxID=466109 RepID=A0A4R3Z2J3_9GAMM|nr:hypothetical protein EDC52_101355 [Biostraticola tofi]